MPSSAAARKTRTTLNKNEIKIFFIFFDFKGMRVAGYKPTKK
jgi:hypothetical protein